MPKTKLRWFDITYLGILIGIALCLLFVDNLVASVLIGMLVGGHVADMQRHKSDDRLMEIVKKQDQLIFELMIEKHANYFKNFGKVQRKLKKFREKPVDGDEWKYR